MAGFAPLKIVGAEQLAKLSKRLKETGDKEVKRELYKALNRATKKPKAEARARALLILPHRGGLAKRVAASRFTTRNRTTGKGDPSLQLIAKGTANIRGIDKGRVRHPVFGHPDRWTTQPVKAGWFSVPMKENEKEARREIASSLADLQRTLSQRL
jgi:hypothetical protein